MNIVEIGVSAFVRIPIYLSSRYVTFFGVEGESLSRFVHVRGQLDKPLELIPIEFNLEGKVNYRVEELEQGRRFKIHFTNIPGPQKNYEGFLKLKTNYIETPEITLWIKARFVEEEKDGKR